MELDLIERQNNTKYCFIIFEEKFIGYKVCAKIHYLKPGVNVICEIANIRTSEAQMADLSNCKKSKVMLIDSSKKSKFYETKENYKLKISSFRPGYLNKKISTLRPLAPKEPTVNSRRGNYHYRQSTYPSNNSNRNPRRGGRRFNNIAGYY